MTTKTPELVNSNMKKKLSSVRKSYTDALVKNDRAQAMKIIEVAFRTDADPLELYKKVAIPAQTSLGQLWANGQISVTHEHLATQITSDVLDYLKVRVKPNSPINHKALITTPAGDSHYLAARVVSDFLQFDGWTVDFLGVDTPTDDLVKYIKERDYSLIALSITIPKYLAEAKNLIDQVKKADNPPKIILGGSAVRFAVEESKELGADAVVMSIDEAIPTARRLAGLGAKKIDLPAYLQNLGKNIKTKRKSRSLSQASLAKSCGLDRAYISSIENGKHNVTVGALLKIAGALSLPLENLLAKEVLLDS